MILNTCAPICLYFTQTDISEKFDIPALLTAGNGPHPDYSQLALTDYAEPMMWRVQVAELVAKAKRMKPPYIPPPEPAPVVAPIAETATKPEAAANDIGAL